MTAWSAMMDLPAIVEAVEPQSPRTRCDPAARAGPGRRRGPLALTRMACPRQPGAPETAVVLDVIVSEKAIRADLDGDALTLTRGHHVLLLRRTPSSAEADESADDD